MATVNLGSIKFKWKGTYAGGTAYTIDDVVSYNGSSYICIQASTGNLPTDTAYFEQMSSAGTNGTDGTDLTTTLTTQGDIVYRDASGLQRLGAGTSGQVLQTGGTGANPSWVDAGGGKVLQVLTATDSTQRQTTSSTFTNASTTLSVTITPSSTSSKILINVTTGWYDNASGGTTYLSIFRDSTNLGNSSTGMLSMALYDMQSGVAITHLDSPSSTSALTYELRMRCGAGTSRINQQSSMGNIVVMEIGS